MKFYLLFLTTNLSGSLLEKPLITEQNIHKDIKIQEYDDNQKAINCRINYKFLNCMFFLGAIIVGILYGCNEFFLGITDYVDIIFFSIVLVLNTVINWITKSKQEIKYSKKRAVCLLLNSLYLISLLSFHTLGYVLNIITDCNLFAGAEDCHSEFTLFQYITECIMFFIIFLKLFF